LMEEVMMGRIGERRREKKRKGKEAEEKTM
jgi:hypothetical protein